MVGASAGKTVVRDLGISILRDVVGENYMVEKT